MLGLRGNLALDVIGDIASDPIMEGERQTVPQKERREDVNRHLVKFLFLVFDSQNDEVLS